MRNIDYLTTGTTDNLKLAVDMTFAKYPQTFSWVLGNGPEQFLKATYLGNLEEAVNQFRRQSKRARAIREARVQTALDFGDPPPELVRKRIKLLEKRAAEWLHWFGINEKVELFDGPETAPLGATVKHTKNGIKVRAKGIGTAMPALALLKPSPLDVFPLHVCDRKGNRLLIWGLKVTDGQVHGGQGWRVVEQQRGKQSGS
jgi:hypothetical protein